MAGPVHCKTDCEPFLLEIWFVLAEFGSRHQQSRGPWLTVPQQKVCHEERPSPQILKYLPLVALSIC